MLSNTILRKVAKLKTQSSPRKDKDEFIKVN
mgnify:CR=1 FL=1|jgi:hypothetical protein